MPVFDAIYANEVKTNHICKDLFVWIKLDLTFHHTKDKNNWSLTFFSAF